MRAFFLTLCFLSSLHAEVIDRLAVTVEREIITELQIDEEIRVTAFLNHQEVNRSLDARRAAADRLINQLLVKHEMELSHYPLPDAEDVNAYAARVRAAFEETSNFDQELGAYQLTNDTLREHLALQLAMLRFVEFRFRPDVTVSDKEIEASYEQKLAVWKGDHPGAPAPSLASWRDSIRQSLLKTRTDEILNIWLEENRKQWNIVYLDKSLQ